MIATPPWHNMHGHLRYGPLLEHLVEHASLSFHYYLAMPNPKIGKRLGIYTGKEANAYGDLIQSAVPPDRHLTVVRTIKITEETTPEIIREADRVGIRFGKIYPKSKTTHADDGVFNYFSPRMMEVYRTMEEVGMYLLLHPEHPDKKWDDSECEYAFFGIFEALYNLFPKLKIVWEHITESRVLPFLLAMDDRVSITVTVHHMYLRHNDVLGKNHHFCRPPAKLQRDVDALRLFTTSGHKKAVLGLDDAPWDKDSKECADACAGVWTTPVAVSLILSLFKEVRGYGTKELTAFTSGNAERFYELPSPAEVVRFNDKKWTVPLSYDLGDTIVVPFMAGKELEGQIERIAA